MMKHISISCVLGLCAVLSLPARGQVASSTSLVGTVTDGTGAVVPGASVVAVQDATKVAYKGQTSATGDYAIPYIDVGTYTIAVEAPGFQKVTHTNVLVEVNQTVRTDFKLALGATSQEMTVSSTPPPIATDDAALTQTLDQAAITSLPVAGHDVLKLALTSAGVLQDGDATVGDPPGESFAGPGTRGEQNDVTLDGVTIMDTLHTTEDFPPYPEAVQEVSVQTGTYSAQYGNYLGVHINAVSKTGGNQYHGAITEAVRNDIFNAHGRFDTPGAKINPLRQNQFGGELDGPVIVPRLYNGRKKTFFMAAYQGRRQISKSTGIYTTMTQAMRNGDFSAINPVTRPLRDPVDPTCITNNVIAQRCINPHSIEYLNFLGPPANLPGLTQNLSAITSSGNNWDQYYGRVDQVLNDKTRFYFRYAYQNANPFTGAIFFPDSSYSPTKQNNFVGGYTQVFTANLVNQFLFGRNQVSEVSANGYLGNAALDSTLNTLTIPGYQNPLGNPGDPLLTISGYQGAGSASRNSTQTDEVWTGTDTISWNHGAHNIIAGADLSRVYTTRAAANSPRGSFTFNGTITGTPANSSAKPPVAAVAGDAAADFMLGLAVSDTTPVLQANSSGLQWRDDFYVLDKWNATHKLSLNIGLRYELPTVPTSPTGIANDLAPDGVTLVPTTPTPYYKFTNPNHVQWAPRVGFAYRVSEAWVVRGGIGIYYSPDTTNTITILSLNPPFGTNFTYNASHANPVISFSNPNPVAALGTASPTPDLVIIDPYFPSGTMNQWSLDVERGLWRDAGIDVQYEGNHTYHLDTSVQENAPLPGPGAIQARRPNQHWGNIRDLKNTAWSNYDGLNVVLTQRMHHGLSMQLNYTWSHSLDLSPYSTGGGQIVNPYNLRSDYGDANLDIRNRFVGNYVWQMPFFGHSNQLLRTALGGWSLSGIATVQGGVPVNVTISADVANTGEASQRPDRSGVPIDASKCGAVLVNCVNASAFVQPQPYTYGNTSRNVFHGPGYVDFDTALAKTFQIHEAIGFQFRADAYNSFNHVNWSNPNGNFTTLATFGNITSANSMRVFELMGKLTF